MSYSAAATVMESPLSGLSESLLTLNQEQMIRRHQLRHDGQRIYISFFSQEFILQRSSGMLFHGDRIATQREYELIYAYLNQIPEDYVPSGHWASLSQLSDSFSKEDLHNLLHRLSPFEGKLPLLKRACLRLHGEPSSSGDVGSILPVFKDISVWLQYWEADDEFEANAQFLWDQNITQHLDYNTLLLLLDYLVDQLLTEL